MPEETQDLNEQDAAQPVEEEKPAPAAEAPQPMQEADGSAPGAPGEQEEPAAEPEEEKIDYGVEITDAGTLKKKVSVTVPEAAIQSKRDEMFGELMTSAQVPGFRIGHAPRRLIEKRFGREVSHDVRNAVIGESLGQVLEEAKLSVLGEPSLDLDAIELPESGDLEYAFEVEVAPEFELPELKGIPVRKPVQAVTDERIDEAIDRMRLNEARYERADEPAQDQDVVLARAKITGEGIDASESSVRLRVAPGQIEGLPLVELGKELTGKEAGQTVTLSTTVPDVHPNESWQGKELSIELTVNEIQRRVLPEANDAYAGEKGFESLAEMRTYLAGRMGRQIEMDTQRAMRRQVLDYLVAQTQFDLPEGAARRHAARTLQRRYIDLLSMGIPREQVDERMTEIQAAAAEQSQRDLKLGFVLQKIADERKIKATEEEVNARVAAMAQQYGRRPDRIRQELEADGAIQQVYVAIQEEKALDALLKDAEVTEVQADGDEPQDDQEAPGGESASPEPNESEPAAEEPKE